MMAWCDMQFYDYLGVLVIVQTLAIDMLLERRQVRRLSHRMIHLRNLRILQPALTNDASLVRNDRLNFPSDPVP
jgi:hypothetical protein